MDKLIDSNKAWELIDKIIAKIQNNNYVAEQKWFDDLWKDFVDLPDKSIDINKYKNKKHPVAEINSLGYALLKDNIKNIINFDEVCVKENVVALFDYEHNDKDGNKIWSDIREIYKTDDKDIYIEKYKNGRTGIITYKEKPLAEVIEDIAIYNIDKEEYEDEYENI